MELRETVTGKLVLVNDTPCGFVRDGGEVRPTTRHEGYEVTMVIEGPGVPTRTGGFIYGLNVLAPNAPAACALAVEALRRNYANKFGVIAMRVGHIANLTTGIEAELFAGQNGDLATPAFAAYVVMLDHPLTAEAMRTAERATGRRFGDYGTAQEKGR